MTNVHGKDKGKTSVKQVRQFMELAGYFIKFIPEFATRTPFNTKLTRINEPFLWTDEQEDTRKYVIDHLTTIGHFRSCTTN